MQVILDCSVLHRPRGGLDDPVYLPTLVRLVDSGRVQVLLPDILAEESIGFLRWAEPPAIELARAAARNLLRLRPVPMRPIGEIIVDELRGVDRPVVGDESMLERLAWLLHPGPGAEWREIARALRGEWRTKLDRFHEKRLERRQRRRARVEAEGLNWSSELPSLRECEAKRFEDWWRGEGLDVGLALLLEHFLGDLLPDEAHELGHRWRAQPCEYLITSNALKLWARFLVLSPLAAGNLHPNDQIDYRYLVYAKFADALVAEDQCATREPHRAHYGEGPPELLSPKELFSRFD